MTETPDRVSVELLPCPFCGGKAVPFSAMGESWIRCGPCGAGTEMSGIDSKAIAAWNRRALSAAPRPIGEAVLTGPMLEAIAHNLCSLHDFDVAFVMGQERFARAVITEYLRAAPAPDFTLNAQGVITTPPAPSADSLRMALLGLLDAVEQHDMEDGADKCGGVSITAIMEARQALAQPAPPANPACPTCGNSWADGYFCSDVFHVIAQPAPQDDGWIEWSGGENPVPGETVEIKIRWRKGEPSKGTCASEVVDWKHRRKGNGEGVDIIAYRVVAPQNEGGAS